MQKRKRQPPSYRQRKGYDQAIFTLTDSGTDYRNDYWLGSFGTPESRELYHRVLAQWDRWRRTAQDERLRQGHAPHAASCVRRSGTATWPLWACYRCDYVIRG